MAGRILIAEDDGDQHVIITDFLKSRGYETVAVPNGEEVLERLAVGRFDLLILDLAMPKVDGWTVLRQLRAQPETQGIPVIVLTAHAFAHDREKAFQAGCNEFIAKPFDPYELLQSVQQLLGTQASGPASDSYAV